MGLFLSFENIQLDQLIYLILKSTQYFLNFLYNQLLQQILRKYLQVPFYVELGLNFIIFNPQEFKQVVAISIFFALTLIKHC